MYLTDFGKFIRKYRIENGMILKEMADVANVSSAFLSGVESGKKSPPPSLVRKLTEIMKLTKSEADKFERAADQCRSEVRINLDNVSNDHRELAGAFGRTFSTLDDAQLNELRNAIQKFSTRNKRRT